MTFDFEINGIDLTIAITKNPVSRHQSPQPAMDSQLYFLIITVVVGLYAIAVVVTAVEPKGPGVCTVKEIVSKHSMIKEYKIETKNISYFCLRNFRFKCQFQTEKITPVNVEKITEVYKTVAKCCDGYKLSENELRCKPVCEETCKWGKCVSPNVCVCEKNYEGPTCDIHTVCPPGKFGPDCKQTCKCENNGSCDPFDGSCRCQAGFTGNYCESNCWPGYYGYNCRKKCNCPFSSTCDPVNGRCFSNNLIDQSPCAPGFYGPKCLNKCKCQNEGLCNQENGNCVCQPGYIGSECERECPSGYYGFNCVKKCNCSEGAICNPRNGYCECRSGEPGFKCGPYCPPDKCKNGGACRLSDGFCMCTSGFYGPTCSKMCPPSFYGVMCNKTCECDPMYCDPIRGCLFGPDEFRDEIMDYYQSEEKLKSKPQISIIIIVLILFCLSLLLIAIFAYRLCYFNIHQGCNGANENNSKHQNPMGIHMNPELSVISSGKYLKRGILDSQNMNIPYTNDVFHKDFSFSHDNYGYNTSENLYFEIDENIVENTVNMYDRLDFLRPAKPWKPHYQKPLVMQEQRQSSIFSSCNRNCNSSSNSPRRDKYIK